MTAQEIIIKHWEEFYQTSFGEGKAPPYTIAAVKEYAKEKCKEQRLIIQSMNPHHTDYTSAPEPTFD